MPSGVGRRLVVFGLVLALALGAAVLVVVRGAERADRDRALARTQAASRPQVRLEPAAVGAEPHLVVRDTALGPDYGHIALVPLSAPDGPRAPLAPTCDRVYSTGQRVLCLRSDPGFVTTYDAELFDASMQRTGTLAISGIPSRARLSADGRLAAMTVFVAGHSYLDVGFSTRTTVSSAADGHLLLDLEDVRITLDGKRYRAVDVNFWGVTFARDDDRFFATLSTKGRTYLVEGDLSARTVRTLRRNAECPSLSPDGTKIAYKTRVGTAAAPRWRLAVLDLVTGIEALVAEQRSVDDQVEWLDDHRLLYGLPRNGGVGTASSDVWVVPADGKGEPQVLVPNAESPAVVR